MARRPRRQVTPKETRSMQVMYDRGKTISEIGRHLDRHPYVVARVLKQTGYYWPAYRRLTTRQKERIHALDNRGLTPSQIARLVGCSRPAVSYHLSRAGEGE